MEHALNTTKTRLSGDGSHTATTPILAGAPERNASTTIPVATRRVAGALALVGCLLLVASVGADIGNLQTGSESPVFRRLATVFSVDRELNIPAFFSMLMLLFSSALLGCLAVLNYDGRLSSLRYWGVLALGFLAMAFDEITSVHERLIEPMRVVLGGENLGIFYFAWVVPGICLALICASWFLRFWWNLPRRTRIQFFFAGTLFLLGALGMELIDGDFSEIYGKKNVTYALLSTLEETFEMAGIIVFIKALLDYMGGRLKAIKFQFIPEAPEII